MVCPFLEQNTHLRVLTGFSGAGRRLVAFAISLSLSYLLLGLGQKGGSSSPPENDPEAGALPHGSSLGCCSGREPPRSPPPPPPPKPPPPPPLRLALFTLAVAYLSDGPISSTSSSTTVRFSPSRVSNERCLSRPCT